MTVRLVYHDPFAPVGISQFDEAILSIARGIDLCLACPYLTVNYLERLGSVSRSWKLITDAEEWLFSRSKGLREATCQFMARNQPRIRHWPQLHAKVVIGDRAALIGSANFTDMGITQRTEMAVMLNDEPQLRELERWFDVLWERAYELPSVEKISAFINPLPGREIQSPSNKEGLFPGSSAPKYQLVDILDPLPPNPLPIVSPVTQTIPFSSSQPCPAIQKEIIDAILGAYVYRPEGNWLSATRQVELLQRTYDAMLSDGRNAFPGMHGRAECGNGVNSWDFKNRVNRMTYRVRSGLAVKVDGQNHYMLAEGVTPAMLGVSQTVVDALAAHGVIQRYDVNTTTHLSPDE